MCNDKMSHLADEDKCSVCNELLDWAKDVQYGDDFSIIRYMEEGIYAVSIGRHGSNGIVTLVRATSASRAYEILFGHEPQFMYPLD